MNFETSKRRLCGLIFFFAILGIAIFIQLLVVQLMRHEYYIETARRQHKKRITMKAKRGNIYDRNMTSLTLSREEYSIYAVPDEIEDMNATATRLAEILGVEGSEILNSINKDKSFGWIKRKVSEETKNKIKEASLSGIGLKAETFRYYPCNELASQVIGFVGVDDEGLEGVEYKYDEVLKGEDGWAVLQRDAKGSSFLNLEFPFKEPRDGNNIVLSIDKRFQEIVELALKNGMDKTGSRGGSVIALNPKTGQILALANRPTINLNNIDHLTDGFEGIRNKAVIDAFEPGSTFKVVTASSVYEAGLIEDNEQIFCENGSYKIYGHTYSDVEKYGWLTLDQIIERSSNIGAIKLAERLGKNRFFDQIRKFGFGCPTGISFPAESSGMVNTPNEWSGLSRSSIAFGQEISVTALQMALAYSVIANGGWLVKPILVQKNLSPQGDVVWNAEIQKIRKVISEKSSKKITEAMVSVIEHGTGIEAKIQGVKIAGKTGTAQKSKPHESGYTEGKVVTSFGGFFPADNPAMVIFVMLDEPRYSRSGGGSAAPIFREVAWRILTTPEDNEVKSRLASIREVELSSLGNHSKNLMHLPISELVSAYNVRKSDQRREVPFILQVADGDDVGTTIPATPLAVGAGLENREVKMPALYGFTVREAIKRLSPLGIRARLQGSGIVVNQFPVEGSSLAEGASCVLVGNKGDSQNDFFEVANLAVNLATGIANNEKSR